jgi:hypothetical protein
MRRLNMCAIVNSKSGGLCQSVYPLERVKS